MPKVFVTQEAEHDFLPAEKFGDIVFLTHQDISSVRNSPSNKRLTLNLREGLKEFDPENDWLVIAGSPYVAAMVFHILGQRRVPTLRILRWKNRDRVYEPVYLEMLTTEI